MKSNEDDHPPKELAVNLPYHDSVDLSDDEWTAWQYVLDELSTEQVTAWESRLEQEVDLQMLVARVVQELALCQASFSGVSAEATEGDSEATGGDRLRTEPLKTAAGSPGMAAFTLAVRETLSTSESESGGVEVDKLMPSSARAHLYSRARWLAMAAGVLAMLGGVSWWLFVRSTAGSNPSLVAWDSDRDELSFSWFEMWLAGDAGGEVAGESFPREFWDLTQKEAVDSLLTGPNIDELDGGRAASRDRDGEPSEREAWSAWDWDVEFANRGNELANDSLPETDTGDSDPAGNWLLLAVISLEEGEADDETWQ